MNELEVLTKKCYSVYDDILSRNVMTQEELKELLLEYGRCVRDVTKKQVDMHSVHEIGDFKYRAK